MVGIAENEETKCTIIVIGMKISFVGEMITITWRKTFSQKESAMFIICA